MQKKQKQLSNYPVWFDGTNINEAAFCEEFLHTHKILFANNAFFTPEGRVTDDLPLRGEIFQKGMEYVQSHTPEEIAEVIAPQFAETDLDIVTTIVKRYYEQDTWKSDLIFEKESFELLEDILEDAGELNEHVSYKDLVTTEYAAKAAEK